MKKVIFISALAIAAAVSCTKSDIVDTKFNEAISFENYIGRDAMTKATPYGPKVKPTTIGLYGFYTGADAAGWTSATNSNLWGNEQLSSTDEGETYSYTNTKYWTNDTDQYTFFAYAPFSEAAPTGTTVKDPAIEFEVEEAIKDQVDFLYSNNKKNTKKTDNPEGVELVFNHALSRITVKASENQDEYDYKIYGVSLSGEFNTSGSLKLSDASWDPTAEDVNYVFLANTEGATGVKVPTPAAAVGTEGEEGYKAAVKPYDFAGTDNYLMVIPTDFSANEGAVLTVTYATIYDNHESNKMVKVLPVKTKFEMGKAYSFDLVFSPNTDNEIEFTVSVNTWEPETDTPVLDSEGDDRNDNPENWDEE